MKNVLFASAALAVMAVAAPAFAEVTGTVDAVYGRSEIENLWSDDSADAIALSGKVVVPASDLISFQFDGAVSRTEIDDFAETATAGTIHAFTRNDSYAVGGFVGLSSVDGDATWTGGVEAQKYFADLTLAGAVAYTQVDDWANVDGWTLGGEARYFINDNLRVDGRATYARLEGEGFEADGWNVGLGAEYQLASQPFSVFGAYDHWESEDLADAQADIFTVGLRWTFGADTLKQRDRAGASFGGAPAMPFMDVAL